MLYVTFLTIISKGVVKMSGNQITLMDEFKFATIPAIITGGTLGAYTGDGLLAVAGLAVGAFGSVCRGYIAAVMETSNRPSNTPS